LNHVDGSSKKTPLMRDRKFELQVRRCDATY